MSCESRNEYISVQRRRYRRAGKAYKTRLLDGRRQKVQKAEGVSEHIRTFQGIEGVPE